MSADTYKINAVFTFAALLTIVALAADTVPAYAAAVAKLIIGAGFTFFSAFRADSCAV